MSSIPATSQPGGMAGRLRPAGSSNEDPAPAWVVRKPSFVSRAKRNVIRGLANLPAEIALWGANTQPVSTYRDRRHEGRKVHTAPVGLTPTEASVVDGLDREGLCVTSLAELGLAGTAGGSIVAAGRRMAARLQAQAAAEGVIWRNPLRTTPADLLGSPEIFRWGLATTLIRIVEAYLRQPIGYDDAMVVHTLVDRRESGARRWHLDREDRRVVKVALYLNDVNEASGPFEFFKRAIADDRTRYRYPELSTAQLESTLGRKVDTAEVRTCTGPAGTLVFAETANHFHRGRPVTNLERSAIFFSYTSRRPRHPFYCQRSGLAREEIVRLVDGLSPDQQACALWRDQLAWPARLVPRSAS